MKYIEMENSKSKKMQSLILFYMNLLIHLSIAIWVRPLYLSGDELGVVAEAAYLIGEDWSQLVQHIGYYGYGQALLYVPIFAVIQNPICRYIILESINSILLSFIPVFIYHILVSLDFLTHKKRFYLSIVTSLFPSYLIYTKWVWNEPLLCLLPWILLWILIKLITNNGNKQINSILLAVVSVWCYATHGRGIVFVIACILTLICICIIYKKIVIDLPAFIVSFVGAILLDQRIKSFFIKNLWLKGPEQSVGNTLSSVLESNIFSLEKIMHTIKFSFSYAVNAMLSSYGIIIIVALFLLIVTFSKMNRNKYLGSISKDDRRRLSVISIFSVLCFMGAFGVSALIHSTATGDYIIYTRYYANTLGLVVLLGLLIINETCFLQDKFKLVILTFACVIPFYIPTASLFSESKHKRPNVYFNLYPYVGKYENMELFSVSIFILIIFLLIIIIATSKYKKYCMLFLIGIFLSAYYYCGINFIIPESKAFFDAVKAPYTVLSKIDGLYRYCDDVLFYNPKGRYIDGALQFVLPQYKVRNLKNVEPSQIKEEIAGQGVVIAYDDLGLEYWNKDYYRILTDADTDFPSTQFIWIYGEEASKYVAEHSSYQLVNKYGEAWPINLEEFYTKIGSISNKRLVSSGESGYLLYGPYMPLHRGYYTITIEGSLTSGELNNQSFFDVTNEKGTERIYSVNNLQQFVNGDSFQMTTDFTLNVDSRTCEFRIFLNEGAILEIDGISLKRLDMETYDFGEKEVFDFSGFSGNEGTFRWTNESPAEVDLFTLEDGYDYQCNIVLGNRLPLEELSLDAYEGWITVNNNDEERIAFTIEPGQTEFSFEIDEPLLTGEIDSIQIYGPLWSPADFGASDTRTLGISIDKIIFEKQE